MQSGEQGGERSGDGVRGPARGEQGGGDAARSTAGLREIVRGRVRLVRFLGPAILVANSLSS